MPLGGSMCCVPGCFNNTKRDRNFSFYAFPKDPKERGIWIDNIGRAGNTGKFSKFEPAKHHRVCSAHFEGGKKSYLGGRPTIFPLKESKVSKPRRNLIRHLTVDNSETNSSEPGGEWDWKLNSEDENGFSNTDHDAYCIVSDVSSDALLTTVKEKQHIIFSMEQKIQSLELELSETRVELQRAKKDAQRKTVTEEKYMKMQEQLSKAQEEADKHIFSIKSMQNKPEMVKFYTGFETYEEFKNFHDFLYPDITSMQYWGTDLSNPEERQQRRPRTLSTEDELFLVLCRLRVGLLEEDLAYRFGVHTTTVSRICKTYFELLYFRFRQMPIWPSREIIDQTMPECFKQEYPSTRVVLDCTELFIETPNQCDVSGQTYSNYKSHNTAKGLLGIAPNGFITFVTDLVPGRMSDKDITENSGLLDLLEEGDSVMADRGFLIDEYLAEKKIGLNIPPFMSGKPQLSPGEEDETRSIAKVRIHVERVIGRVKNYRILKYVFPNSMASDLNKIWVICCYLVNLCVEPIVS
ncbi:uncharacterized protein LOC106168719 [Lingula anatina]|uniref:Uncharacterized protein LOC106168719 n=1 Tax=Lingula anatina TaxID=7574 RepID=A0A1S3J0K8_LINAN|nr:uncharacterized protein LOC106168719 [Lingula anatina]|eukprot:XP_013403344.1 uncharacterized protein LOC106168719 [Lingula anatina]